jgi:hypothetical protein
VSSQRYRDRYWRDCRPALLACTERVAHGLTVETLREDHAKVIAPVDSITAAMDKAKLDLAISYLLNVTEGLHQRKLFSPR